jgi:CRISPR-associated endonuclease/helicase Cas3
MISVQCKQSGERERGIYSLTIPTGSGKTLSSLRFALEHAKKHKLDHIIYVIPYLSVLDQTAKKIREVFAEMDEDFILEHHSNVEIPETDDDEEKYKLLTSRWDSPIILTTMVQFLETIYSNKASRLRKFHNMGNSVIIFDEIQALPIKCVHLFNDAVNFLQIFAKSTILLCTATQPHIHNVDRPVKISENPNIVTLTDKEKQCFERVAIRPIQDKDDAQGIIKLKQLTFDELAELVKEQLDSGKSTLVVFNTKKDAAKLYEKCKSVDCEKAFLTTNLCPAHRLKILERVRDNLKPESKKLTLCISTQLIEAGVDISFDCVIRVVAGLDSIIQASGRCNRNGESKTPQIVYIVKLKEENLSRLAEIKDGQEKTERVIREMHGKNLLSEEAINLFYKYYFYEQKNKMDYNIKGEKNTIYNLLNNNTLEMNAYQDQNCKKYDGLPCAFKTAAENFSVIDKGQTGIVVPYGDAEEIKKQFEASYDPKEKMRKLKELQKYTVSVYSNTLEQLVKEKAFTIIDQCFYFLDKEYYDDELGLSLDSKFPFLYY